MRTTRVPSRREVPLVVRASMPRTFLGLGVFTETGLLLCGSYLLLKALWWPLETGETAVIVAGLLLALATFLLLYMVRPGVSIALAQTDDDGIQDEAPQLQAPLTIYRVAVEAQKERRTRSTDTDFPVQCEFAISLATMPEDSAVPEPTGDAARAPR
jgi:hypothetical protein